MSDSDTDNGGEEAAATVIMLYERLAARYIADRARMTWDERSWLDRFLNEVPSPYRVMDLGCGAGAPIGRYLLEQGCTLTGIDSSPTLIAHCRKHLSGSNWLVGDIRLLALNRAFDGLLAWDSIFHLTPEDQRHMFGVFRAHAAPGAALMFTSGPRHGVSIGTYHERPLYHASLDREEYTQLLTEHGFSVVAQVVEDPACGMHTIWLARRV
jgi:trans-aconitate methyltransferase